MMLSSSLLPSPSSWGGEKEIVKKERELRKGFKEGEKKERERGIEGDGREGGERERERDLSYLKCHLSKRVSKGHVVIASYRRGEVIV